MREPKCLVVQKSKAKIMRIDSMMIFFTSDTRENYELIPINNPQNNITIDKIILEKSKGLHSDAEYNVTITFNIDVEILKNLKENYSSFQSDTEVCIKINNYFIKSNMDFKNVTFVNCERDNSDGTNFKSLVFGCVFGGKNYRDVLIPAYYHIKKKYENKDSDINISAALFIHPNEKGDYSYLDNCQSAEEVFKEF